jgi:hypothetical protein
MKRYRIAFATALVALSLASAGSASGAEPQGVRPVGRDGTSLNLDFEDGTLSGWTATGDAFEGQPVRGDVVSARRKDQKSNHQGEYWIGGFERLGDKGRGTLSSRPFKVDRRWGVMRIAGGPWAETRVELVRADNNRVYFQFSGYENETLRPVVVDFGKQVGQEFFIRVVDERQGHWGHVNFDDFLLYDEKPVFADALARSGDPPAAGGRRAVRGRDAAGRGEGHDAAGRLPRHPVRRRA